MDVFLYKICIYELHIFVGLKYEFVSYYIFNMCYILSYIVIYDNVRMLSIIVLYIVYQRDTSARIPSAWYHARTFLGVAVSHDRPHAQTAGYI